MLLLYLQEMKVIQEKKYWYSTNNLNDLMMIKAMDSNAK